MQDYEIVLVDSGSSDGTIEIANQFGVDTVTHISPEDFSFGRALNYGCEAATGDLCVIASAHVYPKRADWLKQLLEKFNDDIALVYGKQRGNEMTTFSEDQIFRQWFPDYDIDNQPHPFCNNANAAIRKETWEKFPYDEHLTGLEDVDWAKRVQKKGWEISYASDAEIIHVHDETVREVFNRYRREAYAHKEIMPGQSFSFLDFVWLSLHNIASDYQAALNQAEFSENILEIPRFRLLQFWGTYRGFAKQGPLSDSLRRRFFYPKRESYPSESETSRQQTKPQTDTDMKIEYPDGDELVT
jgi:glycosyltransferase involved in cell wall biosynthesis